MFSCKTTKQLTYFVNADSVKVTATKDYSLRIKLADELTITVNSLMPEATAIYNMLTINPSATATSSQGNQTYVVDINGDIQFPVIGRIHVQDMTTKQLQDFLTEKISKEVDNPIVKVSLTNFKVNVLGEVNRPGAYTIGSERQTLLDVLASAGGLTAYGQRDNVLLIREENGQRQFHRLNLKDAYITDSPYFYMQQNDVVYVEADEVRESNAKYDQNKSYRTTVVSTVVSAVSVIASLVIALTVK